MGNVPWQHFLFFSSSSLVLLLLFFEGKLQTDGKNSERRQFIAHKPNMNISFWHLSWVNVYYRRVWDLHVCGFRKQKNLFIVQIKCTDLFTQWNIWISLFSGEKRCRTNDVPMTRLERRNFIDFLVEWQQRYSRGMESHTLFTKILRTKQCEGRGSLAADAGVLWQQLKAPGCRCQGGVWENRRVRGFIRRVSGAAAVWLRSSGGGWAVYFLRRAAAPFLLLCYRNTRETWETFQTSGSAAGSSSRLARLLACEQESLWKMSKSEMSRMKVKYPRLVSGKRAKLLCVVGPDFLHLSS